MIGPVGATAVIDVDEIHVVASGAPSHVTTEAGTNPLPATVMVEGGVRLEKVVGEATVKVGAGYATPKVRPLL